MTTRRRFLSNAAVAAIALPNLISSSRAADPISVVLPLGFSIDFFDAMNAYSGGHYERQGLDAKVIGANTGVQMAQLIVSGQGMFGRGAPPDQIRAVAAKQPAPVAIATICQGCNFRVFSLKDKPVLKPEEMMGKTVGLITMASPTGIYLDVMLAKAGLKPGDVERQATGGTPGAVEILKQGRVDCFISTLAVRVALERANEPVVSWNPETYLPLPGQCYNAMPATMEAKPDLVIRFLKAIIASADEIISGPIAPLVHRAAKDFDIPGSANADTSVAVLEATIREMWLSQGKQNFMRNVPASWEGGVDALRRAGIVDVADPTMLYTNKFIDQALGV